MTAFDIIGRIAAGISLGVALFYGLVYYLSWRSDRKGEGLAGLVPIVLLIKYGRPVIGFLVVLLILYLVGFFDR